MTGLARLAAALVGLFGLAAIFGMQVLVCFFMSWLTRRKPDPEYQPYGEE